ncbi:uroporphyrinogen-III synthase, partial [Mitsuokella multacida]
TRARSQASKLTACLEELGARIIEKPAIAIAAPDDGYAAVDAAIAKLDSYQWLIFTSTNGVERFMQRLFAAGKDVRALGYAKVAAIGQTTAKKLQSYGIRADVVPQEFRAEGILESLKGKLPPHAKILLPRAAVAREILPENLREQGAEVDVVPVYQTVMAETSVEERATLREELENGEIDFVTFTSSSTVVNLVKLLGGIEPLKGVKTACIGPVTAETARKHGIEPAIVASRYTIEGLVEAMRESLA